MRKNGIPFLMLTVVAFLAWGCSPTAVEENDIEQDEIELIEGNALEPVTLVPTAEPLPTLEPTALPATVENITENSEDDGAEEGPAVGEPLPTPPPIDDGLPKLPQPSVTQGDGGLGAGGGLSGSTAESLTVAPDIGLIDFNPFITTTFSLATELPVEIPDSAVLRSAAQPLSYASAAELAQKLGFPLPLYQEAVPIEAMDSLEMSEEGFWIGYPFYSFNETGILTIYGDSAYYQSSFGFSEPSYLEDEARLIARAQETIAGWGSFDFEYNLAVTAPGTVELRRLIDGVAIENSELYLNFDTNEALIYYSYNVLPAFTARSDYSLISAAAAWELITSGVVENRIQYQILNEFPIFEDIAVPPRGLSPFYTRTYQPGEPARIYGFPLIYFPFQDDGAPVLFMDQYRVIGDAAQLMEIAMGDINLARIDGQLEVDGRTLTLSSWQPLSFEDEVAVDGVLRLAVDGGSGVLTTDSGEQYLLDQLPVDLNNEERVFVNGYLSGEQRDGAELIDWRFIESFLRVEGDLGSEGVDSEPDIAIDEPFSTSMPAFANSFGEVIIERVEPGYGFSFQFAADADPMLIGPDTIYQPVWNFYGITDAGDEILLTVPAVDARYFEGE